MKVYYFAKKNLLFLEEDIYIGESSGTIYAFRIGFSFTKKSFNYYCTVIGEL